MKDSSTCPVCGGPLAQGRGGICPACLLQAAMGADLLQDTVSGEDGAAHESPRLSEQPGIRIGHYKLLEQIGEGGFGVVWMAEQEEPVRRRVALKIIKLGMDTPEVVARFEAERQALALMDHPNIARVYDGGTTPSGRPYFVMELVHGFPITQYCDAQRLTTEQRLDLFLDVLSAVQHAHQKGIIHRDLKPSNIMVSQQDGKAVVKVIDFGISKALDVELTGRTLFTVYGRLVGTPEYMSPEQAGVNALDVDTRSDLYSLGVVLYELLTGRTPLDPCRVREAGYAEMQRLIREEEPPKPSTRVGTLGGTVTQVAESRGEVPARLTRKLRGDLDWIVMKALEKARERRYGTASGFAADIRRHLNDEPVEAGPPSASYLLRKLVRRRKGLFAAVGAVTAALLAGMVFSLWQASVAGKARDAATAAQELAQQESHRRGEQLREAARSDRLLAMELFEAGRDADAFAHLARACDYDPDSTLAAEAAVFRLNLLDVARQVSILRGASEFPLARIDRGERFRRIEQGEDLEMTDAAFSPDGHHVVTIRDYAPADPEERKLRDWPATAAEWWNAGSGRRERMELVRDDPDAGGKPPGIRIFDIWLPFDSDGQTAISPDGTAEVVLENETAVLRRKGMSTGGVPMAALGKSDRLVARFAPDGLRVASAGEDHRVRLHTVPGGRESARCTGHAKAVASVRFSPDCARLVTASDDTTARVWEIADRRLSDRFGWDDGMLETVRFSRDDRRIIAEGTSGQGSPGSLLIWDALTGELHNAPFSDNRSSLVGCNSSGTLAILREGGDAENGTARVWDISNRREVARLGDRAIGVDRALFSPDDRVVAIREHDGSIRVWDANDGHQISEVARATGDFPVLCFSPDSRSLLIGPKAPEGKERAAIMVEVATGKVLFEMPLGIYDAMSASFHPAGTLVATGSNYGMARIWEMPSGKLLATLPKHPQTVECVEFSPDGTMLATACWRSTVAQVWRVGSWLRICRIQNPSYQLVEQVAFCPDSRLLAGASDRESTLRIWEARSGQCVACLGFPHAELRDLAFSHDGKRLVIPCRNSGATPESGGPLVLEVPALIPPVPGWFADFLRCLLQRKIGDDGQQRVLTPAEWEELRDRVTTVADHDRTRYGELARWFLAPASSRPLRPGAAMTRHELADRLVTPEAGPVQLARALAFDPANALAHLAMARFAHDDAAREFLQTWARQHLPELAAPELQRRIDALRALPAAPPAPPDE